MLFSKKEEEEEEEEVIHIIIAHLRAHLYLFRRQMFINHKVMNILIRRPPHIGVLESSHISYPMSIALGLGRGAGGTGRYPKLGPLTYLLAYSLTY